MNQTLISTIVSDVISDLRYEDREDREQNYPRKTPFGFIWEREPDEYDYDNDLIWEGNWTLVPEKKIPIQIQDHCNDKKCSKAPKVLCNCPNAHMGDHYCYENKGGYDKWFEQYKKELIENQRAAIARTLNPNYHICTHDTHEICTGSPCCDCFWHEGDCHFVSDDGECGYAVRFDGDQ